MVNLSPGEQQQKAQDAQLCAEERDWDQAGFQTSEGSTVIRLLTGKSDLLLFKIKAGCCRAAAPQVAESITVS